MTTNKMKVRPLQVSNFLTFGCRFMKTYNRMTFYPVLIMMALIPLASFASIEPIRLNGNSSYYSVGLIAFNGAPTCSGTIIRHGVLVTAKHCFKDRPYSGYNLLSWSLHFPSPVSGQRSIFVPGGKIKKVLMDTGDNDIAFLLYNPELTEKSLTVDVTSFVADGLPTQAIFAKVIGFPHQEFIFSKTPRVIADNCQFTGTVGKTPGYDGLLAGTNCGAYWGVSGGPVFIEDLTKQSYTKLVGVVTHTFAIVQDGSIDTSKIQTDQFGKYINDTNVSPLSSSLILKEVLSMDLSKVPDAEKNPPMLVSQLCGYSSFSELMSEASKAIELIRAETRFKPTFWIDNNPAFEKIALENMALKNQALLAKRDVIGSNTPWAKMVFQDFDQLRETDAMRVFQEKGMGQLNLTRNREECDALECTNYFDFTIQMNLDAADHLFEKFDSLVARKNLWAIYGHEYGHFILDYYYLASGRYSTYKEAHSKVDALKHHLTVDAIGMLLTSTDRSSFKKVLQQTGVSEIMGQQVWSGDIGKRLDCFEKLP